MGQRDEVRKQRTAIEETPVDPAYRANEPVRGVRWGMTQEEVIAVKGEPEQRTKDLLTWAEELDGAIAPTSYDFLTTIWRRSGAALTRVMSRPGTWRTP